MKHNKLRLGVNVDHVATLRQARGATYPSPLEAALLCEKAGAAGITIHLRKDRRHIQDADIFELKKNLKTPINFEMANTTEMIDIVLKARPAEVCLVPETSRELTTEGGLNVMGRFNALKKTAGIMKDNGITVSFFIDPDTDQLEKAAEAGAEFVELHTGTFCGQTTKKAARTELNRLIRGAKTAHKLGLKVNAGHGINMANIESIREIPYLDTLNIGHSIVARSVMIGIDAAVREMLGEMTKYSGGKM
ncbi:MAG: pyridoxine 5'-phosphate synthase [Lentisphaerae bacterium]|nr:pyridoxine 5'-phosphate synthase [Lentisphaerota bacterium]